MNTFRGGIHPDDCKAWTNTKPIEKPPIPQKVYIPTRQHIGAECQPTVAIGDVVKKGQLIAEPKTNIAAGIHSSIAGKVLDINEFFHPTGGYSKTIVIESDNTDEWVEGIGEYYNWEVMSIEEIKAAIMSAGIVGLGGAAFPTHIKIFPQGDKIIDNFIINGAECEPYLTADHRLMVEEADKLITGIKICMKILNVTRAYLGIEENKLDAIEVLNNACQKEAITVVKLKTKYPQGAEKMLIKAITGKEVPPGRLPMDIGVVVQNVATVCAIADSVQYKIPLIERIVTISGGAIAQPKNLRLRIGTTFADAIGYCGGFKKVPAKIIMGGPMMGIAQTGINVPVIKGTSGILALSKEEIDTKSRSACIRCGRCIAVCPMGLRPGVISILGERGDYIAARDEEYLLDCVECGSCEYACPARRNIVHYVKLLKAKNAARKA